MVPGVVMRRPCLAERLLDGGDAGKPVLQHHGRVAADVRRRAGDAVRIGHRKGQCRLGDIGDLEAEIGGMAGCGFAALLGADAGDDQVADAVCRQPDIKAGADEGGMATLFEDPGGRDAEALEGAHMAALLAEGASIFHVEDLKDRQIARSGAIDQRLLAFQIAGKIRLVPIGAVAEGFLHVDDDEGSIGHFRLSNA